MDDISLNTISVLKALKELEDNNLICIDVSLETYLDESCINSEPLITKKGKDFLDENLQKEIKMIKFDKKMNYQEENGNYYCMYRFGHISMFYYLELNSNDFWEVKFGVSDDTLIIHIGDDLDYAKEVVFKHLVKNTIGLWK